MQENTQLKKDLDYNKLQQIVSYDELKNIRKSYRILNVVFTSKIREIIDIKSTYLDNLINIKKTHQNMLLNLSERIDDLQYKLKDKKHEISMSCRICYNEPINIIIEPCHHIVMCKTCFNEMENIDTVDLKCPLCQEDITSSTEIYLPE